MRVVSGVYDTSIENSGIYKTEIPSIWAPEFFIKPGNQYFLDSIVCYDSSGICKQVPHNEINATYEDVLHYECQGQIEKYRFVFKEVSPWSGEISDFPPYSTRDGKHYLIYSPEELIYANCHLGSSFEYREISLSLQNDLDFDYKLDKRQYDPWIHWGKIIYGNNKLIKHHTNFKTEQSAFYMESETIFWGAKEVYDVHIVRSRIVCFGFTAGIFSEAEIISGCTFDFDFFDGQLDGRLDSFKGKRGLQIQDCINFGDWDGWDHVAFSLRPGAKNIVNWGDEITRDASCFDIMCNNMQEDRVSRLFNFGNIRQLISAADTCVEAYSDIYFSNIDLAPAVKMPEKSTQKNILNSRQLIDSAFMRNLMGDSAEQDFIFEDGFYPRLRHMDERPGRLAASPILLYPGENADSVVHPFYVDTNYGVRWVSLSPGLVEILGDSGYVRMPVDKDSVVRIEAWKEDFSKHVYLTIRARSFVNKDIGYDTVCPGDSVWMKNTYARKQGWNYDVIWGEGNEAFPDTVYRLHLHHLPTYYETYTDSCYIEQLPYTVGGRQMRDFGTYTENLVTTAGCDSVREYSLSRRWRHYRVSVRVKGAGTANVTDTVLREDGSLWLAFTASSCYRLDSLKIDGRTVPPQNRYELKDLHGDCEVVAVFTENAPAESVLRYEVCGDSLPIVYNGEAYGEGEHTIVLRSAQGCDSVLRLMVQGKENTARLAVLDTVAPPCGATEIAFSYRTETGNPKHLRLAFDPAALSAGFRDTTLAIASPGKQTVHIALPPSARPDRYGIRLWQADGTGCYAEEEALNFEIPYPSDIIVQKWNDVLAVLSAEYNGGYEFSGYQWYKNGEPMEGETKPYLYVKPYLRSTDTYAVLLERASDGLKLQSCGVKRKSYPKELSLELLPNPTASGETVQVSVNGKPEAEGTIEVFDGTGKPVYQKAFNRSHTLRADWQPGSYVVRVRDGKGSWTATGKLVVR